MTNTTNQLTAEIVYRRLIQLATHVGLYIPRSGSGFATLSTMADLGLVKAKGCGWNRKNALGGSYEVSGFTITDEGRAVLDAANTAAYTAVGVALFEATA